MSVSQRTAQNIRERFFKKSDPDELRRRLSPRLPAAEPLADRLSLCNDHTAAGLDKRQGFLKNNGGLPLIVWQAKPGNQAPGDALQQH